MKRGFLVIIRFLDPAKIRAIRLVLVTSAAYMTAKLKPGSTLVTKHVTLVGWAINTNVVPWQRNIPIIIA